MRPQSFRRQWRDDRDASLRLLDEGRATRSVFHALAISLWKACLVGWGGLSRKELHGSPWGFDTFTFRSWRSGGTEPRRAFISEVVGSRPTCVTTPPSDRGSLSGSQPGGRGSVPRGGTQSAMRSSSAVERVAVNHRRRGFEPSLRSQGTVAENRGTRLQPGERW
jgi:hypothetical protein